MVRVGGDSPPDSMIIDFLAADSLGIGVLAAAVRLGGMAATLAHEEVRANSLPFVRDDLAKAPNCPTKGVVPAGGKAIVVGRAGVKGTTGGDVFGLFRGVRCLGVRGGRLGRTRRLGGLSGLFLGVRTRRRGIGRGFFGILLLLLFPRRVVDVDGSPYAIRGGVDVGVDRGALIDIVDLHSTSILLHRIIM